MGAAAVAMPNQIPQNGSAGGHAHQLHQQ